MKPTSDFWILAGLALVMFAIFAGAALLVWAGGPS